MKTTSVCISGRNGNDKWRQKVGCCNCLRSFGAEGGSRGHHNLNPHGRAEGGCGGDHNPHPHGKSEGGPGGHCNLHPHGRAGGGSRGHHNPYPSGKLIPGIRGAEALPGRYNTVLRACGRSWQDSQQGMMLLEFVQGRLLGSIFPTQPGMGLCYFHASVLPTGSSKEEKVSTISGHKISMPSHQALPPAAHQIIKNIPHKTAAGIKTA